jgi:hypothetical protein
MGAALHTEPAISDDQPIDGPLRIAITAGIGCVFGGIIALTVNDLWRAYNPDPTAPWYMLKLSQAGWHELISAILVTIIAVLFLEPLIEFIRWHERRPEHVHPALRGNRPRVLNWLLKFALGIALLLLSMSHDAVRVYVDMKNLNANGAVAVQLVGAAIISFGTTWAWAYGERFRLAAVLGCMMSLSLAAATFLVYKQLEPQLKTTPDWQGAQVFTRTATPSGPESSNASVKNSHEVSKAAPDADNAVAGADKVISSSSKPPGAVNKIDKLAADANQMPTETKVDPNINNASPTGSSGKSISIVLVSLWFVFYAVSAWILVGLLGGLILDLRRSGRASMVLPFGLVAITVLCDLALQFVLSLQPEQKLNLLELLFWFGLGAGWAAGIFILGPSVDIVFGRREKNVPALAFKAIAERWRGKR